MPAFADRVLETTTTTGTGNLTTAGAVTGYQTFNTAFGTNLDFHYTGIGVDGSNVPTGEWEVGIGSMSDATTLVREYVSASSNGGALVNFSSGTKQIFCDVSASSTAAARTYLTLNNPLVQI